uniref:Integrase catalytic domain-containing protein n=1 Tax=Chenopodium quinoa TaxID=63459 RepID=A0A803NB22_CHEQI
MAGIENQSNTSNSAINFNDPYFLSNGDHPGMPLGTHILTGANFLNWSRAVKMALIARNKLQFVDGSLPMPATDSADYQKWLPNDYMVMSWILNSMDKVLAESFMFVNSSNQLWIELTERFGRTSAPRIFELHKNLTSIQQNDMSIAEYFGQLKSVWDQLQILKVIVWFESNYDQVKTNLLGSDPLPHVHKAYYTLQQVEQQHKLNSMVTSFPESGILGEAPGSTEMLDSSGVDPVMASAVYNQVIRMMNTGAATTNGCVADDPLSAAVNFAGITSASHVVSLSQFFDHDSWIVDSGATDHMASNLALFSDIHKLPNHVKVSLPDGSVKLVLHSGIVNLNSQVKLDNVLYIPEFRHNLLSVGKLLDQNDLVVVFEQDSCSFQDSITKSVKATGIRYQVIRSDNGTEIIQEAYAVLFASKGVIHQKSIPGTPEQNGRVERKHRHLLETARTLRLCADLPYKFWDNSDSVPIHIPNLDSQNSSPESANNSSPESPNISSSAGSISYPESVNISSVPVRVSSRPCKIPSKYKDFVLAPSVHKNIQDQDTDQSSSFNVLILSLTVDYS